MDVCGESPYAVCLEGATVNVWNNDGSDLKRNRRTQADAKERAGAGPRRGPCCTAQRPEVLLDRNTP